jgi:hypothetical protein
MATPIDFATVQYARKLTALVEPLADLPAPDLGKLGDFLKAWGRLKEAGSDLKPQQIVVILQGLHTKDLLTLEAVKGGVQVEFTGGGFEYERFLLRQDGRVPNHRYQARKARS